MTALLAVRNILNCSRQSSCFFVGLEARKLLGLFAPFILPGYKYCHEQFVFKYL